MGGNGVQSVNVRWYLTDQILYVENCISLNDYRERDRQLLQYLNQPSCAAAVHLLLDYSGMDSAHYQAAVEGFRQYAHDLFSHPNSASRDLAAHFRLGWVVSIGSPETKYIGRTLARVGRYNRHDSETLHEAIEFLCLEDSSLAVNLRQR